MIPFGKLSQVDGGWRVGIGADRLEWKEVFITHENSWIIRTGESLFRRCSRWVAQRATNTAPHGAPDHQQSENRVHRRAAGSRQACFGRLIPPRLGLTCIKLCIAYDLHSK